MSYFGFDDMNGSCSFWTILMDVLFPSLKR